MAITEKGDVYTRVTNRIIADLEQGARPWFKPWSTEHAAGQITRPLRHNGTPYQGVNIIMLWAEAAEKGFSAPTWMTYKQAQELGGQVRRGEQGSQVVYANRITRTDIADNGDEIEREIPFLKSYTVFNVEQVDGLPASFHAPAAPGLEPAARIDHAEQFFAATGASICHGGNRAYYAMGADRVQMPPFVSFHDPESYYATLAHEVTHWTSHPARLNRDLGRKRWGDEGYAAEELVAELGSAFLCADLGLTPEVRDDHAAYIASWLSVLKNDKRAIFTAAALAQKAADFLHGFQRAVFVEAEAELQFA